MNTESKNIFAPLLDTIRFNQEGLVPVITQNTDGQVLMLAWMNKEALLETLSSHRVCYYSRSRKQLWRKGERSGQIQILKELCIDCDSDTLLAKVEQTGVACHTGRKSCFFKTISGTTITDNQDVLIAPETLYDY